MDYLVLDNDNNEQRIVGLQDGSFPLFLFDRGYKQIEEVDKDVELLDYQELLYKDKKKSDKIITRTYYASDLSLGTAKTQHNDKMRDEFLDAVSWTDNELQFFEKLTDENKTSYRAWFDAVKLFHQEAWAEREKTKKLIKDAKTVAEVRSVVFDPTYTNSKEALQEPVVNFGGGG